MTAYSGIICDICRKPCRKAEGFVAERGGKKHFWDVGECCMNTPFQVRDHTSIQVTVTVLGEGLVP